MFYNPYKRYNKQKYKFYDFLDDNDCDFEDAVDDFFDDLDD